MDISRRELSDERTSSPELALNCVILPRGVFFLIGKGGAMSPLPPASTPESLGAVNCAMVSRDLLADLSKLVDGDRLPDPPDKLLPLGGDASGDEVLDCRLPVVVISEVVFRVGKEEFTGRL